MGDEKDVICIGGYPEGKDFDINKGAPGERPATDKAIAHVPVPSNGPLSHDTELCSFWSRYKTGHCAKNVKPFLQLPE